MDDIRLQTGGRRVTTRTVRPVVRRGVGLGGWMNMENFITGFPSTETLQRAVLDRAPGEEGARRFFDRFLDVFFGDADGRRCRRARRARRLVSLRRVPEAGPSAGRRACGGRR